MRLIPVIIIFMIMVYVPSALYSRHIMKKTRSITESVVGAFAVPTFIILGIILINRATLVNILDTRFMIWSLWVFLLIYLPLNIYSLFYVINKAIKLYAKRTFKSINYTGLVLAGIVAFAIILGAATRHHIKVRKTTIYSKNLPAKFDGLRIAHITDLHLGNLSPRDNYLKKIVTKLTEIRPDMLVFTGDMMNISAEEVEGLDGLFDTIDAPYGRYAVMGNHDYGDYKDWKSEEAKEANLMAAYEAYRRVGFVLLNDSVAKLTWEHYSPSSDSCSISIINIIGVENCGKPPFPHYGDLAKATEMIEPAQFYLPQCYNSFAEPAQFNILLSHDPTHWREEVLKEEYKYIDLTLSGHTHSAQIGINLGNFKWSPSQWLFDQWDGLYEKDNQYLFVSRGLGYVGIPFRLGMPAEISIIELRTEN